MSYDLSFYTMRVLSSLSGHTVSIIVNLSSFSIVVSNLFVAIQALTLGLHFDAIIGESVKIS